jgi:hypothetical protein
MSGLPSWARKGAKVVCINTNWRRGTLPWPTWLWAKFVGLPIAGGVYTITDVGLHEYDGGAALRLQGWGKIGFHVDFFRPLLSDDNEIETVLYRQRKGNKTHSVPRRKSVDA